MDKYSAAIRWIVEKDEDTQSAMIILVADMFNKDTDAVKLDVAKEKNKMLAEVSA